MKFLMRINDLEILELRVIANILVLAAMLKQSAVHKNSADIWQSVQHFAFVLIGRNKNYIGVSLASHGNYFSRNRKQKITGCATI